MIYIILVPLWERPISNSHEFYCCQILKKIHFHTELNLDGVAMTDYSLDYKKS